MFYTYIIHSEIKNKYYIGYTSNITERIRKHNSKSTQTTKVISDWKLAYSEEYNSKTEAIKREKQIKKWKSRKMLENLIAGWSSGSSSRLKSGRSWVQK
ncbi:MAG: GIY-YIG nuclease family protein [Candidatus Gracilibacteria bacterium]|jgi:putative endonuclease|nr:GIY-YIG nuclease family protein [Candidatus Gracilibacteria bacterium]MDD5179344.1 GIY-YIG nuclease family protein [Candidatus Gracilibacteria bacterium]